MQDLTKEIFDRQIVKECKTFTKAHMLKAIEEKMKDVSNIAALLYPDPLISVSERGLGDYESLCWEPLHDCSGHIKNLLAEIPHHLPQQIKDDLKGIIAISQAEKAVKRAIDYRLLLAQIIATLKGKLTDNVNMLFTTMLQIQGVAYASDEERTPKNVLHLHIQTFLHHILLKEIVGIKPKELTARKLYGAYFHAISRHASIQYRIISGSASYTEEQERTFNTIKNITTQTSNFHEEHIIGNLLIRMQGTYAINYIFLKEDVHSTLTTMIFIF